MIKCNQINVFIPPPLFFIFQSSYFMIVFVLTLLLDESLGFSVDLQQELVLVYLAKSPPF